MSQTKVQLIQPIGIVTAPGVNVSGTLTATTFDGNLVGAAGSIIGTPNVNAGIVTAVSFYGNGENLTGVAGSTFIGVVTAAQSGTTTIDLSLGNIIYFTQDTNTTVAFANTESTQVVDFIRAKDDTTTARTITWPDSIIWDGGSAPTLIDSSDANDVQIFKLITRDQGVTWYGYEAMKNDPAEPIYLVGLGGGGNIIGANNTTQYSSPVQIPGNWSAVDAGYQNTAAVKTDGTLWIWSSGGHGILGQNDNIARSSPIQIPGTQWTSPRIATYTVVAKKTDNTVWTWGRGANGLLGINDQASRSSPVQLPGTQWKQFSSGFHNRHATKTDGTLWAWGQNDTGSLGVNDTTNYQSPKQIPGTQWSFVSGTYYAKLVTKTDGTLWTWGANSRGQLGINNRVPRSSPIQIPGTQWSTADRAHSIGGSSMMAAIKTDGTLWMSGINSNGQLGQNDNVARSSPVQVPGTQWSTVDCGEIFSNIVSAMKTDGTVWVWGNNGGGQLSQNDNVPRSSPVQVPGTWTTHSTGGSNIFVI